MKYTYRYAIAIVTLITIYILTQCISIDNHEKEDLNNVIQQLKERISYLETKLDTKEENINYLKESLDKNLNYLENILTSNQTIQKLLSNVTLDCLVEDEHLPSLNHFLPHLNKNSIKPKLKLSNGKQLVNLVIGVPTIKREKTSYLLETLKSLLDCIRDDERDDVLVVIMIAELHDQEYINKTISSITQLYQNEIKQGLVDIVVPPSDFYPHLERLQLRHNIYNDSVERFKWRTKQNYDFAYLMTYAWKRGMYYLQLEDDVVTKTGFIQAINEFVKKQKTPDWLILDFTQIGFIGKLFQTKDLPKFISFFLMFSQDKPVDWLCDSLLTVKSCNPERDESHCDRSKIDFRARYKPSLFQHVGVQSSLKGKIQKIKDKDFGKQLIFLKAHNNPPATLSTSLKTYMKFTLDSVYLGQNFFWSINPKKNDFILVHFHKPYHMTRYYIKSGNPEHPDDRIHNATLQIQPHTNLMETPSGCTRTQDDFYIIDSFKHGILNGQLNPVFGAINKIRIHFNTLHDNWILVSEIDFSSR